jgi:hypothetical protein
MKNTNVITQRRPSNYGALTDASKGLNMVFGDKTGRTVSRRTTHGFKNAFSLQHVDDEDAEDLMHGAMIASGGLLMAKNDGAKVVGLLLLVGLIFCYHAGKE